VVTFPHWPLVEMMSGPVGVGWALEDVDEEEELILVELVELDDELELDEGVGVGVGVGVDVGTGASPHLPNCGWQPTSSAQ